MTARIALVIRGDGRPLIAYGESVGLTARVFDCIDAACSSGTSRVVASDTRTGSSLALALDASGVPVIAKGGLGATGTPISLVRCANAGCSSVTTTNLANEYGSFVDLVLRSNGRPLIAATAVAVADVLLYDCTSLDCSTRNKVTVATDVSAGVALALDGGTPVLAFQRQVSAAERHLRFHRCAAATCSSGATRTLYAAAYESVGAAVAMAVRSDGRPVIAHHDLTNQDLLLHVCANRDCL